MELISGSYEMIAWFAIGLVFSFVIIGVGYLAKYWLESMF